MNADTFSRRSFILVIFLLSGCALNESGTKEVSAVLETQAGTQSQVAASYAPSSRPATAPAAKPAPLLSALLDYIILALQNNEDILAAQQVALAKARKIPQVTALPDPMIGTRTFSPNRPMMLADGNNPFVMTLTQQLPHPEKLDRAGRIALEETRMALRELEQTRLRVIADVKRAWFQLYVLDRTIQITRENQTLLSDLIAVARIQVTANKRPQDDILRAQVELSNLDRELIELRQNRTTAAATLNTLLDRPPYTSISSPESFALDQTDLKIDQLISQAGKNNPELKKLEHQITRDRENQKLARLGYWPDVTVGLEWMAMEPRKPDSAPPKVTMQQQPNGTMVPMVESAMSDSMTKSPGDMYAIMVEMNLPIWLQKTQAQILEAEYNLGASIHQYNAAKNMVNFRIQDALARVQAQKQLAEILKTTIIPQARQTYEVSRVSYTAGTSDFPSLIDTWQKWLTFTIQYHRALGELQRSLADLEQEIGTSLSKTER